VDKFTGEPKEKCNEIAHIIGESTPLSVLLLFLIELITLQVVETHSNYQEHLHLYNDGHSPQTDVTETEIQGDQNVSLQLMITVKKKQEKKFLNSFKHLP
jgi:hypothetical protein